MYINGCICRLKVKNGQCYNEGHSSIDEIHKWSRADFCWNGYSNLTRLQEGGNFADTYLVTNDYSSAALTCYLAAISPLLRSVAVWDLIILPDVDELALNQLSAFLYSGRHGI